MSITLTEDVLASEPPVAERPVRQLTIAANPDGPFADSISASGHRFLPLPEVPDPDFNRGMQRRIEDGALYRDFFRQNKVDLLFDTETASLTLVPDPAQGENAYAMTHATCDIPYISHFIDPVTETMKQVSWHTRWALLEHPGWIKWIWDDAHAR